MPKWETKHRIRTIVGSNSKVFKEILAYNSTFFDESGKTKCQENYQTH